MRIYTPATCESRRIAAEEGYELDWFRWMFAACDREECEPCSGP